MFDDADKGQFHCDECGICRVGGRDNYFHCNTCGLCLPQCRKDNHKLVCYIFFNQALLKELWSRSLINFVKLLGFEVVKIHTG